MSRVVGAEKIHVRGELRKLFLSWWFAAYLAMILVVGAFLFTYVYFYYWSFSWAPSGWIAYLGVLSGPIALFYFGRCMIRRKRLKAFRTGTLFQTLPAALAMVVLMLGLVPSSVALAMRSYDLTAYDRHMSMEMLRSRLYKVKFD